MTMPGLFRSTDWNAIGLVVFDVDGTLYRQRALRLKMGREILIHTAVSRDVSVPTVLAKYRGIRERLADDEVPDFEPALIAETARRTGKSPETVHGIVSDWFEQKPLRHLGACSYPELPRLFAGLRSAGKCIGILSDYPAKAKLDALGLTADHIVCAGDKGIGRLKPHPRGLEALLDRAGATAAATLVIGDRPDRDGAVAQRLGARALIKSRERIPPWQTFACFDDPLFAPVLT